jgi:hypothetical protein
VNAGDYLRNGALVIRDDGGADDEALVAEAVVAAFVPIAGNAHCVCGTPFRRWNLQRTSDGAELACDRCHAVHARIELEVEVWRE